MKINWKRIVIATIIAELVLIVVYVPLVRNNFQAIPIPIITVVSMLVFMFLGGFWAVKGSKSHFFIQGLLVGFFANIFWYIVAPLMLPDASWWNGVIRFMIALLHPIKILAGGLGGYVYGRRQKKILDTQTTTTSS